MFFATITNLAHVMTYEGGVTSVNAVSGVSLKTRVIGAVMEHRGRHDPAIIRVCCLFLTPACSHADYNN